MRSQFGKLLIKIKNIRKWTGAHKVSLTLALALISGVFTLNFAAAATTQTFGGRLTPTDSSRTHTVTMSYSGTLSAKLDYSNIPNASLSVYNNAGSLVASGSGATPITLTTTAPAGTYTFKVQGTVKDKKNSYTLSVVYPDAPPPDVTAPTAPSNLAATSTSATGIKLDWTASTDAVGVTGYSIYRNSNLVGTSTTPTYTDTGLTAATSYSYYVLAYDAAGNNSSVSDVVSATTLDAPVLPPTPAGFVTAAGTNFMLDGAPFRYIGFNAYGMAGCYNGVPWTTTELDTYFSKLPANGVTRLWAFRSYGTERIQTIVASAAKYNQRVILTLADTISTCGDLDYAVNGSHSGKTLAYYEGGWKNEWLTWANTIVPVFKDNPTVMMWEISNEPAQVGAKPTHTVMKEYLRGTSDALRALDPNHLISVGSNTPGNYGGTANYIDIHSLPNLNAISFHDYSYEYENRAIVSNNFNVAKQASSQHGKPFYGGEAGAKAGDTCTSLSTSARADFLQSKANSYFTGGIGGLNFWQYERTRASWVAACAHEMYPTDPMVPFVQNFVIP